MRLAVAQAPGVQLDQWQETLTLIDRLISHAANLHADLLLLPECVWPAYYLGSKQAYFDARQASLPAGDFFLQHIAHRARARRLAICAGYVAESGDRLFNVACLVDSTGRRLTVYHKCFLWDFDRDWFEAGCTIMPAQTPFGPVGLMICADARLPEIPATLAAQGAQLIIQPTAWVNVGPPDQPWNPQPDFLIPARAREFALPIASASKWGVEGDTTYVGSSLICDADGNVLARCGPQETTVVTAEVELAPPRRPSMTDDERASLLSPTRPTPPRADVHPLDVWPSPAEQPGDPLKAHFQDKATGQTAVLTRPTLAPLQVGHALIGTTTATQAFGFAPIRHLALQGVHLVAVFGNDCPTDLLRTRACENRIFLVVVGPNRYRLIDPRGCLIKEADSPRDHAEASRVTLDVTLAADKCVAPGTDILAHRRPEQYTF